MCSHGEESGLRHFSSSAHETGYLTVSVDLLQLTETAGVASFTSSKAITTRKARWLAGLLLLEARSLGRSLQRAGERSAAYQSAQRAHKWPSGSESYGSTHPCLTIGHRL